jgi:hypothetical protein
MPEFTLHRNFVLRTTKGHAINFRKGKPTYVPPMCVPDAVAIGAQALDGDADVLGEEVAEPIPLTQPERDAKIREAIETMVGRNERNDFTGSGLPDIRKMNALTGFEVSKRERDRVWQAYQADVAEATLINPQDDEAA